MNFNDFLNNILKQRHSDPEAIQHYVTEDGYLNLVLIYEDYYRDELDSRATTAYQIDDLILNGRDLTKSRNYLGERYCFFVHSTFNRVNFTGSDFRDFSISGKSSMTESIFDNVQSIRTNIDGHITKLWLRGGSHQQFTIGALNNFIVNNAAFHGATFNGCNWCDFSDVDFLPYRTSEKNYPVRFIEFLNSCSVTNSRFNEVSFYTVIDNIDYKYSLYNTNFSDNTFNNTTILSTIADNVIITGSHGESLKIVNAVFTDLSLLDNSIVDFSFSNIKFNFKNLKINNNPVIFNGATIIESEFNQLQYGEFSNAQLYNCTFNFCQHNHFHRANAAFVSFRESTYNDFTEIQSDGMRLLGADNSIYYGGNFTRAYWESDFIYNVNDINWYKFSLYQARLVLKPDFYASVFSNMILHGADLKYRQLHIDHGIDHGIVLAVSFTPCELARALRDSYNAKIDKTTRLGEDETWHKNQFCEEKNNVGWLISGIFISVYVLCVLFVFFNSGRQLRSSVSTMIRPIQNSHERRSKRRREMKDYKRACATIEEIKYNDNEILDLLVEFVAHCTGSRSTLPAELYAHILSFVPVEKFVTKPTQHEHVQHYLEKLRSRDCQTIAINLSEAMVSEDDEEEMAVLAKGKEKEKIQLLEDPIQTGKPTTIVIYKNKNYAHFFSLMNRDSDNKSKHSTKRHDDEFSLMQELKDMSFIKAPALVSKHHLFAIPLIPQTDPSSREDISIEY